MEFVLLAVALGLASGIAGLRLTIGADRRIRAVQRLQDGQAAVARRRVADLEGAVSDAEARLLRARAVEAAARRTHAGLLSAVSREMRGPLDVVMGFADLLRLNEAGEPLSHRQAQAVDQIRDGTTRLLTLVEGLMTFAGAAGPTPLARERLDPLLIARRVCRTLAERAEAAGVELHPPPPQAGLTVLADAQALEQVLTSLILNAVQHNRPGGAVRIEGRRLDAAVSVTVRDTGPGLEPRRLPTVFEPFARRGRAASSADGAGVGLAAARRLTDAMGGALEVESTPGEGAVFTLRLPAPPRAALPAGARLTPVRLPDSVLLFIADDAAAVALMRHLLQSLGRIQLHVAATRDEGATLARDLRPDAVILDVDLAGGDGLAVKAALDADPLTRGLPVLALSAAVDPEEARRGQAAGFVDYLTKPVRIAALAESLLRLLAPPPGGPQTAAGA